MGPGPVKMLFGPPAAVCTYDEQTRDFRPDVLAKVRALRPPLLHYPGGTVARVYHWQDGVGPNRRVRKNLIWGGNDASHATQRHANGHTPRPTACSLFAAIAEMEASIKRPAAQIKARTPAGRVRYQQRALPAGATSCPCAAHSITLLQAQLP
jgi:hypothetical protein